MTLEEAIKHCNEEAVKRESDIARQLAEWLRELEWRRNAMVEIHEAMLMPASMAERISKEVNTDEMDN